MPIDAKQIELILPILRSAGFLVTYCHREEERAVDAGRASRRFVEAGLIATEDEDVMTNALTHSTWQTNPPVGLSALARGEGSTLTTLRPTTV